MAAGPGSTIAEALAATARLRGAHPAIVEDVHALSWEALDAGASAIARRLVADTRGERAFTCLLFAHRRTALPALYGAMRAGTAAVPLDLDDPDDRLRAILASSAPVAILAEPATIERARAIAPPRCSVVDTAALPREAPGAVLPPVSPGDLAMCQYTSGSTGLPKGVLQTHRAILRFAGLYVDAIRGEASDRHSFLPKLSFSASTPDVFGALVRGATLVAYDVRRQGARALADWIDGTEVSVLHAVPMVVREMLEGLAPGRRLASLRAIDMAGQPLFERDVATLRRHVRDDCRIVYRLAATEHNLPAIHVIGADGGRFREGIAPVGRPPEGTRIEILREDGSPAGIDEVGDVVVVSAEVSPGYRDAGSADASAISPDPRDPSLRRFRSGDVGRLDAEGYLTLIGRRGSRVRIHGHSVDLVEVEAALSRCAGVRESAVVVPEREPDRLVAYVVAAADATMTAASLRRDLATRVPSYMLPGAFAFVDRLPVTLHGKPDRRGLAARDPPSMRLAPYEAPRDDLERAIVAVFEDMLAVSPVGRADDFFLMGGDSLALADLQARLRDACGVTLSKIDDETTVAGLASQVRRARSAASARSHAGSVLIPLREQGSAPPLFLVHGRLGQAPVSPRFLRLLGDDQPVWAFRARGLDGASDPHDTIEAMARDYVSALGRQRAAGPYFLGSLCAGAYVAAEMARRLKRAGHAVLPLLFIDPPDSTFPMTEAAMSEEGVLMRLRAREQGMSIDVPLDDPDFVRASVRTATAFERAIAAHRPRGFGGPVFIVSSHARAGRIDLERVRRLYPRAERVELAGDHRDVLNPDHPDLARHLAAFLARVREAVPREPSAIPGVR